VDHIDAMIASAAPRTFDARAALAIFVGRRALMKFGDEAGAPSPHLQPPGLKSFAD
jgi:hypothetical protein